MKFYNTVLSKLANELQDSQLLRLHVDLLFLQNIAVLPPVTHGQLLTCFAPLSAHGHPNTILQQ